MREGLVEQRRRQETISRSYLDVVRIYEAIETIDRAIEDQKQLAAPSAKT
jgi:hypothetical protein